MPVAGEELERLKGVLTEKSEEYATSLREGDLVVINKGPFEGSEGKVIEISESKGLVKVNVNLLGRDTPVEIDFASVKVKK